MSTQLFGEMVTDLKNKAKQVTVPGREETLSIAYIETQAAIIDSLMSTGPNKVGYTIPIKEALWSADASILFPKVINDKLMKPKEPIFVGQNIIAKTIQVDNVRSMEFPYIGAIRATDLAAGQELTSTSSLAA